MGPMRGPTDVQGRPIVRLEDGIPWNIGYYLKVTS